jgi:hypothetical protein
MSGYRWNQPTLLFHNEGYKNCNWKNITLTKVGTIGASHFNLIVDQGQHVFENLRHGRRLVVLQRILSRAAIFYDPTQTQFKQKILKFRLWIYIKLISSCWSLKSPNLCSYVLHKKLILAQLVKKKLPSLTKPEDLFSRSKAVVTRSHPEPLQSSPHIISLRSIFKLFSSQYLSLPSSLCPLAFPTIMLYGFLIYFIRATCKPIYRIWDCYHGDYEESILWVVTPCSSEEVHRRFGGTYF